MPARAAGLPPAAAGASTYDWSGFYLGGTAGVAWGSLGLKSNTPFTGAYFPDTATLGAVNAAGAQTIKQHGIPVGLEAGFNWQAPHAPWVVVPADDKKYARAVVAAAIIDAMNRLKLTFPEVDAKQQADLRRARRLLQREGR